MSVLEFLNKRVSLFGRKVSVKRILLVIGIVLMSLWLASLPAS